MSYTVKADWGVHKPLGKAWDVAVLDFQTSCPDIISEGIENFFNQRYNVTLIADKSGYREVVFKSESEYMLFLLEWL